MEIETGQRCETGQPAMTYVTTQPPGLWAILGGL